jgi:alpha-D-ribose 1-methylphosphonate 5-triphosphate diphosphatase
MSRPLYLTRAAAVLPTETLADAAVVVADGKVQAINPPHKPADGLEEDLGGAWLLPGLVDLHSDAIEKIAEPRAGVRVPLDFATTQLDRQCALVGITTCFHSPTFAGAESGLRNNAGAAELVHAIKHSAATQLIDNRVHCRFEVCEPAALDLILNLITAGACDLVSLMDHSPGQGQFKTEADYRYYLANNRNLSADAIDTLLANRAAALPGTEARIQTLAAAARDHGLALASHDDDTPERVAMLAALGARISEFPVSRAAAHAARELNLATVVGAPNVVRGGSHDGNLSALELIADDLATCVSSDYIPATMLPAVFRVQAALDWPLHRAAALAAGNPAAAAGLTDRGQLAPGQRADLIAVQCHHVQPVVTRTWVAGQCVLSTASRFPTP